MIVTRRVAATCMIGGMALIVERCLARPATGGTADDDRLSRLRSSAISVKEFGARGDGKADDTDVIVAADHAAAQAGRALHFPAGVYLTKPARATTSWIGEDATRSVLRHDGSAVGFAPIATSSGVNGIVFADLGFDGAVSPDPTIWNATNHDAFRGAAGLSVDSCRDALVLRCLAVNMRQHGFRLLKVNGGRLDSCTARRSRGTYGDGFLLLSCSNVIAYQCQARDYTRAGFVADRTDLTEPMCHDITINGCQASDGHHASSQFGGTEFNSGVWLENCTSVNVDYVTTRNNPDRGISACSGTRSGSEVPAVANIVIRNCKTAGGIFGICTYSLGDLPINARILDCTVDHAIIAFQGAANNGTDTFIWTHCHASYDAGVTNGRGFATEVTSQVVGKPSFTIGTGCTVGRWNEDKRKLDDPGALAATADIGGFYKPAGPMRLTVSDVRTVTRTPLYIRWYNDQPHDIRISNADAYVSGAGRGGVTIASSHAVIRQRPSISR